MERVSTLMDGEYNVDEAAREIARLTGDSTAASLRDTWATYHLIGDTMRGSLAPSASAFGARFNERLAQEPTVLAPHTRSRNTAGRKFQTYALSAAASVAAVAVVGWAALSMNKQDLPVGQIATAPTSQTQTRVAGLQPSATVVQTEPLAAAPQPANIAVAPVAPEQFQEYLLAHQGISPTTAIQGVTPYIRTVSSTGE